MGDAKRRRQLGLAPVVLPFEVQATPGPLDQTTDKGWLLTGLESSELNEQQRQMLRHICLENLPNVWDWPMTYRTRLVTAGKLRRLLASARDAERIEVPWRIRFVGAWLPNATPEGIRHLSDEARRRHIFARGGAVHLRQMQTAAEGQPWQEFPDPVPATLAEQRLAQHPLWHKAPPLHVAYEITHDRAGRIAIHPEPPGPLLAPMEGFVERLHGEEANWERAHRAFWAEAGRSEAVPEAPLRRRVGLELRQRPLLRPKAEASKPLLRWGEHELHVTPESARYSIDGENWLSYTNPFAAPQSDDAEEFFADMFDVETLEVTVWANGNVNFDEEKISLAAGEHLTASLRRLTGAGGAAWQRWSRAAVREAYIDAVPELERLPETQIPSPVAIRLDIPLDAAEDTETEHHFAFESEMSFDGLNWFDPFFDEPPPPLAALQKGETR